MQQTTSQNIFIRTNYFSQSFTPVYCKLNSSKTKIMYERKIEEINGITYVFHISTEQKGQFCTGYISLQNNQESFRNLDNPSLTIKRILYFHIYQNVGKYLIIKTADIETDEEYKALFEIVDINNVMNNTFNDVVNFNNEVLSFELKICKEFEKCENYVPSPFANAKNFFESNTQQIMDLFQILVFKIKVTSSDYSRVSFTNEIEDYIQNFLSTKFGNAFNLIETERITCNQNEIQIKYVIMPNGF